jgi:hypothetical protein
MTTEAYEQLGRDGDEEKANTEQIVSGWDVQPLPGGRDTDSAPFDEPKTYQETEGRRSTPRTETKHPVTESLISRELQAVYALND